MKDQEKDQEFRVTDKRGAHQEEPTEQPQTEASAESSAYSEAQQPPKMEEPSDQTAPPFPEANLLTLVFSLYTHAQISLGLVPNPMTQQIEKDVPQAKYNIDLLGVLKAKTQGNLSTEEEQAFDSILYELRMLYVNINK